MNEQEYRQTFKEDQAVGWEAIDTALKALYGDYQTSSLRLYYQIHSRW